MRRILLSLLALVALGGFVVLASGADDDSDGNRYWVELDNAFGLIEGADLKIAGVRAGKVTEFKLDRGDMRALVGIEVTQQGFGDLRTDTFCESRPQSLIGEYFLDCKPGKATTRLKSGGTIPVKQTGSTIPVDLVNNIMRRPYRERFSILLSELGVALAARGEDLNETIRRANPALRETNLVLGTLAEQRNVISDLYKNADKVLLELADNRKDVTRFVSEARDTARTSASRADGIRAQFQRFPTFLRELRPTLNLLGQAADRQVPALRNLNSSSTILTTFLNQLGPFAEQSQPAFRSLASAARTGRRAVRASRPQVAELRKFTKNLPETADNLAITLEHLDDPKFATEKDARSGRPTGGFTGLEAVLRYVFSQSQAINLFDSNSHILKVNAFVDRDCAFYADIERAKAAPRCATKLGPNQPGITSPDFTKTGSGAATREAKATATKDAVSSETTRRALDFLLGDDDE